MRNINKHGFSHIEALIVLVVIIVVGSVGFYVQNRIKDRSSQASTGQRVTQTYSTFTWPDSSPKGMQELTWKVTPLSNPSPHGFYWATDFTFKGSGINNDTQEHAPGYVGLQSETPGGYKKAIFSIWRSNFATSPGIAKAFGHEGSGFQTIIQYNWKPNKVYTFTLSNLGLNANGRNRWKATVQEENGERREIGTITVPGNWTGLNRSTGSWTEYFAGTISSCTTIPVSRVRFTDFSAKNSSGATINPLSHVNTFEAGQNCASHSRIRDIEGGTVQEIGPRPF